jgi:hypothetical protein
MALENKLGIKLETPPRKAGTGFQPAATAMHDCEAYSLAFVCFHYKFEPNSYSCLDPQFFFAFLFYLFCFLLIYHIWGGFFLSGFGVQDGSGTKLHDMGIGMAWHRSYSEVGLHRIGAVL